MRNSIVRARWLSKIKPHHLLLIALFMLTIPKVMEWALLDAQWLPVQPEVCSASSGACWAFLWEKWRVILFGAYPYSEIWRPAFGSCLVFLTLIFLARKLWPMKLVLVMLPISFMVLYNLLDGRALGLEQVGMVRWHGVSVVTFLGVFSIIIALPLGILLALARHDGPTMLCYVAIGIIEIIRAIPLVTVLFFGIFVLPLLLPIEWQYEPLLATLMGLTVFHAAYFAEDIRGGLQSISKGQGEAAEALGMSYMKRSYLIILPQALSKALPSITNTVIGGFKDTSLVAIVGIFDLLATTRMAYSDPLWQNYAFEGLLFVGVFYFVIGRLISAHSVMLERKVFFWREYTK